MHVETAADAATWDAFLGVQRFRPFLQSWTMGDVHADCGQEPVRLVLRDGDTVAGICFGHVVPARRGKHLSIPYGPVLSDASTREPSSFTLLTDALADAARSRGCGFLRMSPFVPASHPIAIPGARPSPLHLLAEHVWYLPLITPDPWAGAEHGARRMARTEEELRSQLRKTTRNLIGRAERDGVAVAASADPAREIDHFLRLHEETRKRHSFTPYTDRFFRAQLTRFAERGEATLYLARYRGEVIAASIHMHAFGETSYHHGASTHRHAKIPASYLLQWTAIRDALRRGDHVYNFWGIAPPSDLPSVANDGSSDRVQPTARGSRHPFSGVTLFKTGFGGTLLTLQHCMDLPLSGSYTLTRAFETFRKWRRGF